MKHERGFLVIQPCPDCQGERGDYVGRRGANDPDVRWLMCDTCEGVGEIALQPIDLEDE